MVFRMGRSSVAVVVWSTAAALLAIVAGGCTGGSSQSSEKALQTAFKTTGGSKQAVAKFSGTVTIDGKPLGDEGLTRVLVILTDPTKPVDPKKPALYVPCSEDGKFEFTTYEKGDGVPPGHYVVCFTQLKGSFRFGGGGGWHGPDGLKNLYNDPDKNKDNKEFAIEITAPGKTDWTFNLETTSKEAVTSPGPHAFTDLR
jgi:hypothetical protein